MRKLFSMQFAPSQPNGKFILLLLNRNKHFAINKFPHVDSVLLCYHDVQRMLLVLSFRQEEVFLTMNPED